MRRPKRDLQNKMGLKPLAHSATGPVVDWEQRTTASTTARLHSTLSSSRGTSVMTECVPPLVRLLENHRLGIQGCTISLLQVQHNGIVNARLNVLLGESLLHGFPVLDLHNVEVIDSF